MALFIVLNKVVPNFSVCERIRRKCDHSVTEQYFPVVLFIKLYKVVQTFEFADKALKFEH